MTVQSEEARLRALHSLNVLDTPAEERFDRYARIARRLFGVPVALVSLVDRNRQWFKSHLGIATRETSREVSFCSRAIEGSDILVVEDASKDPRFLSNPLVTGTPGIRFYAGCPLPGPKGYHLGTLCIIDLAPRRIDAADLEALRDLGHMVAGELQALDLATLDELTGLSNRRGFEVLSEHAMRMCRRSDQPATLALFDIKQLRDINARAGYHEGDLVLIRFSEMLRDVFGASDVIARLGGDEFAVLLVDRTLDQANTMVAELGRALSAHNAATAHPFAFGVRFADFKHVQHGCILDTLRDADRSPVSTSTP